ncbi:uncharacterized protein FTJAE_1867 [Fusarium tjaetaba]|uniref:Uncharacterized protein n=1 Tax=Fusarium tjaetaba TaxID=1567544 RepID=A0A8H5S5R1_9HYPO|nr:uncharacterized protein FTJAE_1867 [Fusarium tjaetaba]KAF5647036.1 hypothetical protein FTJAE_1867 [Fusarium tjaetaba]
MNADMATNAQLVHEARTMPPMQKPKTLNELQQIVYQYLAKHTKGGHILSWRAMVSVCDRIPLVMNLITNHLLAMDEGDPMKVAEWSCNFEIDTFHKSVSKEVWREEMQRKISEFCSQRKGNEPRNDVLRDKYGLPFIYSSPRMKTPEDVKWLFRARRKPVYRCQEVECALSLITYTEQALQQHMNKEHTKPRQGPLESAQQNLALTVGAELHGGELTAGAAANLVMPSSDRSGPSVPYTVAQDRAQGGKVHRPGITTDLGKRRQPEQITTRGVLDGRTSRPSTTNKRPLREIRAKSLDGQECTVSAQTQLSVPTLSKPKSFFGKQKVWMARGEDLALFNTHRPNIQNLLRHSCIPESSHKLWIGLYRVGATEEEAKTFVVVSCTNRRIRKLTRDILSSCPIFQPGQALDRFKVISKATLPETACEPQQTMQDEPGLECEPGLRNLDKGKNIANDEYKTIRISPSITGDNYLCRQVQARHVSGKGEVRFQTATAGPLLNVDGRAYQLTVAHVVNFEEKDIHNVTKSTTDDWDDWDESDDDTDIGCSADEDVASWDISTSRNSTSDASDNDIPSSLSSDSAFEVATQRDRSGAAITEATSTDEEPIDEPVQMTSSPDLHLSERPVVEEFLIDHASPYLGFAPESENCQISREMDYLLIPTNVDLQARTCTSNSLELIQMSEAFELQGKTEPRPVIIATASVGYVGGVVFPAPSLLRPRGSKDFQTLFCIESDSAMPKGSSGSAVFDKRTGLLAGYLGLGCPEKNIWYMFPISEVLGDMQARFSQNGKCQIRLDVDAVARLSDQRYSPNTNRDSLR